MSLPKTTYFMNKTKVPKRLLLSAEILVGNPKMRKATKLLNVILASIISVDLLGFVLSTFAQYVKYNEFFFYFSFLATFIFAIEYILRVISAPFLYQKIGKTRARIKYMFSFFGIIDLIAILPLISVLFFSESLNSLVNALQFTRLFLVFKISRYSPAFCAVLETISSVRGQLFAAIYIALVGLMFCASITYFFEKDAQPEAFSNIGQGMYWAAVTYATVGYGDIVPITPIGKLFAGLTGILGVALLAIPSAIISAAFVRQVTKTP